MLGLLGTFAGMIVTLGGAASALDNSTELSAIRSALAAPIAGLSLAFGTSIAGVAASAMPGLATLSRRDRLQASRALDTALQEKLHPCQPITNASRPSRHWKARHKQRDGLGHGAHDGAHGTTRRATGKIPHPEPAEFHSTVGSHYQTLADSVAQSLKSALDDSSKLAAERVESIVIQAMEHLHR